MNKIKSDLLNAFFENKSSISGKEILSFCDEKQINMFILFLLMKEWKSEVENMKSPYFDFNSTEVKNALEAYMNVVSKNILIQQQDFEPLLEKSINYTFQLVENPESFVVSNHLESDLSEISKYIQYHKPYFDGDKSYEAQNLNQEVLSKLGVEASEDVKEEEVQIGVPETTEEIKSEKVVELSLDENSVEKIEEKKSINDKLAESLNQSRIVDNYSENDEEVTTVKLKKIDNIKNAITINQKFVFVNELFKGDSEQYNSFIDRLDNCLGLDEAFDLLATSIEVDAENEAFGQLGLLIKQKYNFSAE